VFLNIYAVMKRNSDIASLFQKHEAKKAATAAATSNNCSRNPVEPVMEEHTLERVIEEIVNPMPPSLPQPPSPVYDIDFLPHVPGEKQPIQVILLMIKMQFEEHVLLKVHSNLLHMIFQKERCK
jgi:hypothetical protein